MNPSEQAAPVAAPCGMESHELLSLVYNDLRRLAAVRLEAIGPGQTLQPTALVHEAWLQIASRHRIWESRTHFLATAAEMMRHIVVDHLRAKCRAKRGGGQIRLDIDEIQLAASSPNDTLLALDDALQLFEREHAENARIVILKFFGGLTDREAAEALGVSERTIERHWAYAKAWLALQIKGNSGPCRDSRAK